MKRSRVGLLILLLVIPVAACTKGGPAELLETAKFEELQTNVPHARELYQRILDEHPGSAEARIAKERLAALDSTSP
jgi:predicted small lipoprotein YifL